MQSNTFHGIDLELVKEGCPQEFTRQLNPGPHWTKAAKRLLEKFIPNPKLRLREQFAEVCRFKHLAARTEVTYWEWTKRFLVFHRSPSGVWRHPREMGAEEVARFLSHLASERKVSASTQNVALNSLVFLYQSVLDQGLGAIGDFARAKRPKRLPVVLTREEVNELFAAMDGAHKLMAQLLYGTGMRLMELLRLRIKDVNFARNQIVVRGGKGDQDHLTVLPGRLKRNWRNIWCGSAKGIIGIWRRASAGRSCPRACAGSFQTRANGRGSRFSVGHAISAIDDGTAGAAT